MNLTIEGLQFKDDEHGTALNGNMYGGMNIKVIPLGFSDNIQCIKVKASEIYNEVELWKNMCKVSRYYDCKVVCNFHNCQFIVDPGSSPDLIDKYISIITNYRLLTFGPDAPTITNKYLKYVDSYFSSSRTIDSLYKKIEEERKKIGNLLYDVFASDVKDVIDMNEFRPGTPKVVKKNVNAILKMLIGINDKAKQKYVVDFNWKLGDYNGSSNKMTRYLAGENIFQYWLSTLKEMEGNYGENFNIVGKYIKKYLKDKLKLDGEKFEDTILSHFIQCYLINHC